MLKTIIKKELTELKRDTRFKVTGIIILILLCIAGFTGFNQYRSTAKQYEISKNKERKIWDTQSDKNPHSAAHDGTYVFKPKNILSLVDNGVNKYTGNVTFLEAHSRNKAMYSDAFDETDFARNNKLTLNFVLLYLFPLLILLIGFNIISKEKEQDTLRLLKSQGVKPFQLILGKWFSIFSVVFLTLLTVFLFLGIGLCILETETFEIVNYISLFISYLLYYIIIITITIFISLVSKNSGIALVLNLSIWILFCFVMPKIATNTSDQLFPYPSYEEFKSAIKEDMKNGFNGHNPNNEKGREFKKMILKKYGVDSIQQLKFNYNGLIMQKGEEESSKIYTKHYKKLYGITENQNATYQSLAFLSPFIPTRLISMDLSHTGYREESLFSNQTEIYRIKVQKFLNDAIKNNSKLGDWSYKMKTEEFKNLPKFTSSKMTFNSIMNNNISNIIILLLWLIVPFILLVKFSKKI